MKRRTSAAIPTIDSTSNNSGGSNPTKMRAQEVAAIIKTPLMIRDDGVFWIDEIYENMLWNIGELESSEKSSGLE